MENELPRASRVGADGAAPTTVPEPSISWWRDGSASRLKITSGRAFTWTDRETSRLDMRTIVPKVCALSIAALIACAAVPGAQTASGSASPTTRRFVANGYVCIRNGRWLVVDAAAVPACNASQGLPLGRVSAVKLRTVPTVRQGAWQVTNAPMSVFGRVTDRSTVVTSIIRTLPKGERTAESMSTVEVARFDQTGATTTGNGAQRPTRNVVFTLLPAFAAAAHGATVRTARYFDGLGGPAGGFVYGAQVRDAGITAEQRTAVLAESRRLGIPVLVLETAARTLLPGCTVPPPPAHDDGLVDSNQLDRTPSPHASWAARSSLWPPTPTSCDELTQVLVIRHPIVAPTDATDPGIDTVIDAMVRLSDAPS